MPDRADDDHDAPPRKLPPDEVERAAEHIIDWLRNQGLHSVSVIAVLGDAAAGAIAAAARSAGSVAIIADAHAAHVRRRAADLHPRIAEHGRAPCHVFGDEHGGRA